MELKIGVGKYDVTGPCAGIGFMGMSKLNQRGRGIQSRLFTRAFVIEDLNSGKHVALVIADLCMCSQAVHQAVIKKLNQYPPLKVNGKAIYTEENVLIAGSHTHSGPGGYSHYFAYNLAMIDLEFLSGFNGQNFDTVVEGIFQSIVRAHQNKTPGKILLAKGELADCGKIRSLPAYVKNPEIDENTIPPNGEADPLYKEMILLKFVDLHNVPLGTLNWFALHPTNLGEKGKLVSADNKGYAEELLEKEYGGVIAAFANSCCGDISPNVGKKYGRPDGVHDTERAKEFGKKMYQKARELFEQADEELQGTLDYRQTYVDMSCCSIAGTSKKTWPAAFGLGMSQGSSEDSTGPGTWPEGTRKPIYDKDPEAELILVKFATSLLGVRWPSKADITPEYIEGHGAKPIMFHLGMSDYKGSPLVPSIMPLQLIRLGGLVIIAHPGEMTTIAGMRLRKTVLDLLDEESTGVKYAVIATYANAFSSYTTTAEEYDMQHYEGASTLFGPWTLDAYRQENAKLAKALKENQIIPPGPTPPNLGSKYRKRITGVKSEKKPLGKNFGDVEGDQPHSSYQKGETVNVSFWGGHPNNNLKTNSTYLEVQKNVSGQWRQVYTDNDFCTVFHWQRRGTNFIIDLEWKIPEDQETGTYRLCYYGHWKNRQGQIIPITGISREFNLQ
jgi:neutral ceramidase